MEPKIYWLAFRSQVDGKLDCLYDSGQMVRKSDYDRLRWLVDHGERHFGSLWRAATDADIDAVMQRVSASPKP